MVQPLAKNVFIPLRKQKHYHQQMNAFMTWDLYFHIHMSSVLVTNSFQAFFPFTTKSVQYTVHLVSHFGANAVCFFSTLNPGFSVSIGLGEIVLTRCSLFIRALFFQYIQTLLTFLYEGLTLRWIKHLFPDTAAIQWPCVFKEIALQVSKGNSYLNFPHSKQHLLIVVSPQSPSGQIRSPR